MVIGEILKAKRTKNQLTQEQLSEKIFVSRKTISNWETGKTTPDIDSLIRLANLFDLSLDNLLFEGSEVVENIKKDNEIRALKNIKLGTLIISVSIILYYIISWIFYKNYVNADIFLLIITFGNLFIVEYITKLLEKN